MTCLVEDLLLLARGNDAVTKIPFKPLDVRDVMRDACLEMRALADLRQIRIRSELGDEQAIVSGSHAAVRRLLIALLDNAVKHSPMGSDVIAQVRIGGETIDAGGIAVRTSAPESVPRTSPTFSSVFTVPTKPAAEEGTAWDLRLRRVSPTRTAQRLKCTASKA